MTDEKIIHIIETGEIIRESRNYYLVRYNSYYYVLYAHWLFGRFLYGKSRSKVEAMDMYMDYVYS